MENPLKKAEEIIEKNKIELGVKAGYYYPDFWCRDALITSLGLSLHQEFSDLAKKCITTCLKYQKFTGQVPNKISPTGDKIDFGEGGCVDASLWLPIACLNYLRATDDRRFIERNFEKIEKSLKWVSALDVNNDNLLETTEGCDWMDMLLRSGRVLYDNVLFYAAQKSMKEICELLGKNGNEWKDSANRTRESINLLLWLSNENLTKVRRLYGYTGIEKDYEIALRSGEKDYYIADLGFRKYDPRFDVYANILAVFFDVADKERKERILKSFEKFRVAEPYPVKVLVPPISRNDAFWCFYFRETDLGFLQEPGNFHNGGIWPFVGGFFVATLKKENLEWKDEMKKLIEACSLENWKFYEWINPFSRKIGGSPFQTWNAGMLIFAKNFASRL